MVYRVKTLFADLQDNGRIYQVGEIYPRPDFSVSDARLSQLASSNNKTGAPIIEIVEEMPEIHEISKENEPAQDSEEISLAKSKQALKAQKTQNKRGRRKKDDVNA